MKYDTSELFDIYHEEVNMVESLFSNFGGRTSFGGQITIVKCFEDNDLLEENVRGRVLPVDGGGSVRRALIDAQLARLAAQKEWEGIVLYGSVRHRLTNWKSWKSAFRPLRRFRLAQPAKALAKAMSA